MQTNLRTFGRVTVVAGLLLLACGLAGLTDPGQSYLRGPSYGRAARVAKESGDTATLQAAAFRDDDTAMGAGLFPCGLVIISLGLLVSGTLLLRKSGSRT